MKIRLWLFALVGCVFSVNVSALELEATYQLDPNYGSINGSSIIVDAEYIFAFPSVQDMKNEGFRTDDGKFAMKMFHFGSGYGFFQVVPAPSSITILQQTGDSPVNQNCRYQFAPLGVCEIFSENGAYSTILAVWDTDPANLSYNCDDFCLVSTSSDPVGVVNGDFYFVEEFNGADEGPNLQDADSAFTVSGGVANRSSSPSSIENNRHAVRTLRTDYNLGDWVYTLDFNMTTHREIIYIGFGAGVPDSAWLGEPGDSVHFRIHTSGIDGSRGVHVMERTLGQLNTNNNSNYLISAGNMPGEGTYTARIRKVGNSVTFSIDGAISPVTVSVPSFLNASNARLFFSLGDHYTTFDTMIVAPPNTAPGAECQDVSANTYPTGACSATVDIDNNSSDPDGDDLTFSQSPAGPYGLGDTLVTMTVSDGALTNSCSAVVTVTDGETPELTCSGPEVVECANGGAPGFFTASASDNCSANLSAVSCDQTSGSTFPLGNTPVSCSVNDGPNTAGCSTSIEVVDTIAPDITCPVIAPVECTSPAGATVSFEATASDVCGVGAPACDESGSVFAIGDTPVSCAVTDLGGNSASCGASVPVVDTTAPAVSCGIPEGGISGSSLPLSVTATVEDTCSSPAVSVSFTNCTSDKNGASTGCSVSASGATILIEELGKGKSVNWTASATDPSGNSTTVECSLSRGASNQGLGNGPEGSDPGNSNQGDSSNSNDENGGTPGNPGKRKGKGKG